MLRIVLISVFVIYTFMVKGQNTRDIGPPKPPAPQYQSAKKSSKQSRFARVFKRKEKTEVEAFRERVSESYKKKAKEEKKSNKPQFKDPTYFGHKKPPKKRPPGKQKFCKQCGMKH
jgi:hypothetical protein